MADAVLFARDHPAATLSRLVDEGKLRRIARGVYVSAGQDPERIVARYWRDIVGSIVPGAVITDRSAVTGGPVNAVLYLANKGKPRTIDLPGLLVAIRRGHQPVEGDIALPGGLYQASRPRALLENTLPSRTTPGRLRPTLTDEEVETWIDRFAYIEGLDRLSEYREPLDSLAKKLDVPQANADHLKRLIGSALGNRLVDTASPSLDARQRGVPYDPERIARFDRLVSHLRQSDEQSNPASFNEPRWRNLAFFEAYFSNFIEGTEFTLDEALDVVYENKIPRGRQQDSHDLIGTFQIVSDEVEMSRRATSDDEFLETLCFRHSIILAGRPGQNPGKFKQVPNRAGQSLFVAPDLVEGTLRAGFSRLEELDTPWERAAYAMFLVSEVHPFDDGNGRVARIMMNSELVAGNQARIIIPTVFRDDYLGGLRRFTRGDDPSVLIKTLRFAHDYTAGIDFSDITTATSQLVETHAFEEPDSPQRLVLPPPIYQATPRRRRR